ncbi:MAG: futalosine hydrolase [bacterium]
MRILVVAATVFEIRPFLEKLHRVGDQDDCLGQYQYKTLHIDVLVPGVGMIPAAYHLGSQLATRKYDLAVNAGIAGTYNPEIRLGTVVNITEDCVPELGAEDRDKFLSIFELGLADPDSPPYTAGKLVNNPDTNTLLAKLDIIRNLPRVRAITSNTVRGNSESIERIRRITDADLESMEGAAFFYACMTKKVPCLQIRSVSNLIEERDRSRWNLDLALKNLNSILMEIFISIAAEG